MTCPPSYTTTHTLLQCADFNGAHYMQTKRNVSTFRGELQSPSFSEYETCLFKFQSESSTIAQHLKSIW